MKNNKLINILSIIVTIISLTFYLIFNGKFDLVEDLSLSLFSASCLLIFTSFASYGIEKNALKRRIFDAKGNPFSFHLKNNNWSKDSILVATFYAKYEFENLNSILLEFYEGSYIKNKRLKRITDDIKTYVNELVLLNHYIVRDDCDKNAVDNAINRLNEMSNNILFLLIPEWMESIRFQKKGKYVIPENFPEDYESNLK